MVELVGGIPAVGFADISYSFVFFGALFLCVQVQLYRTLHIFAELPALVVNVSFD
jgi:hypothetical protein